MRPWNILSQNTQKLKQTFCSLLTFFITTGNLQNIYPHHMLNHKIRHLYFKLLSFHPFLLKMFFTINCFCSKTKPKICKVFFLNLNAFSNSTTTGQNQGFLLYLNLVYSITHQKGFCSTAGRKSECLRKLFQIISIYSSVCLVTLLSFSTMSSTGFFSSRAKIISLLFCS